MRLRALWIAPLALALVLAEGCDSGQDALDRAGGVQVLDARAERPAPGALRALSPEPIDLDGVWAWKDIWVSLTDLGWCSLDTFGFEKSRGAKADREFIVEDLDNHFVLTFGSTALDADQCAAFRVQLPNSEHAGLWWARGGDLAPDAYPFSPERFAGMTKVEPGLFEVDTATVGAQGNWSGQVRLIRIDPYGNPGETIELQKVEVKLRRTAVPTKASTVKAQLKPDGVSKGTALLMRAQATGALDDLEAVASLWFRRPDSATELGRGIAVALGRKEANARLESGDTQGALRAFSVAAQASGDPVGVFHEVLERHRSDLWSETPYLVVNSFEYSYGEPLFPWSATSGRSIEENGLSTDAPLDGSSSAFLKLSEPVREGRSWYLAQTAIPVGEHPFSIRFWFREAAPSPTKGVVLIKLPAANQLVYMGSPLTPIEEENGWKRVDVGVDIHRRLVDVEQARDQHDISGARVELVGLSIEGPANDFWLDRLDIYLPDGASEP